MSSSATSRRAAGTSTAIRAIPTCAKAATAYSTRRTCRREGSPRASSAKTSSTTSSRSTRRSTCSSRSTRRATRAGPTEATYTEPLFLQHLLGGLRYAIGTGTVDFNRARPEENRFTRVVLAEKLDEPIELAVLPDERVLFIERHGYVNLYKASEVHRIATIPVSTKYADSSQAEDGLLGLAADPDFAANGWVYMYYSPAGPDAKNVLARFTMMGDSLDLASKKVLLEIPTQR